MTLDPNQPAVAAVPASTPVEVTIGLAWPREAPQFIPLGATWAAASAASDPARLAALGSLSETNLGGWIDQLHRAGIVADRHNSPDLFGQLNQAVRRPIDTVLCAALDVDPAACLNSALVARYPLELAAGVALIGRITQAGRAAIITDARVPSGWFGTLRRTCNSLGIRAEPIINDYPQADPTLMLYALLGRRLRPGRLPSEAGTILFDAAAAVAIGRFALLDERMIESPLAIRDHATRRSFYLTVPIGMSMTDICERLKLPSHGRVLRAGDLLRDVQVQPDTVIGGGESVFHSSLPSPPINPTPCIRCGWCVDSCPTRVQPATILEACQRDDIDLAEGAGMEACIECGICSYVCASHLPLLQSIQKMKLLAAREAYAVSSG